MAPPRSPRSSRSLRATDRHIERTDEALDLSRAHDGPELTTGGGVVLALRLGLMVGDGRAVIPPEGLKPTPGDTFEARIREIEVQEAAQPERPRRPGSTRPQRVPALTIGEASWAFVLAGLSQ